MNDYLNLIKEFEEINEHHKSIKDDYEIFEKYINQFLSAISLLKDPIIKKENPKGNSLFFFIEKYNNFSEKIKELISIENVDLIRPLKQVCETQNNQMDKVIASYKKIKNDLFEEKLKLNNAKKEYDQILNKNIKSLEESKKESKGDNSSDLKKNEDNLLYDTKKNSYFVLYKYELEKLNEKIDKSNEKYKILKPELDSILSENENTYKIIILKLANLLGNIGELFLEFKNNLEEKLLKGLNENLKINQYYESDNNDNKERFRKEKLETNEETLYKFKEKENNINEDQKKEDILENTNERSKILDGMDFIIMNEPFTYEDSQLIELVKENVGKLLDEKEISSSDISHLLENMRMDIDFSLKFIEEIKQRNKNNVIQIINEQNFIHISNVFNELIISKGKNIELINQIIQSSEMIKYNNISVSSMITRKNKMVVLKKFWINLIDNNLKIQLEEYIKNLIENKQKEIKSSTKSNIKLSENILVILNNISLYKKLYKKQKIQVENYTIELILLTISKIITYMGNFTLPEHLIMDIIAYYGERFELGIEPYYYFENILSIKFQKNNLKMNSTQEHTKEKYGFFLNKEQLIILNASEFLPKEDYIKLFALNKFMYSKLKKYLIKYRLIYLNISIEERIQLWEICLNIKEIRKKYDYNVIKNNFMNNSAQVNYYDSEKKQFLSIIDLDLERTPLFNSQETHKIKANFILKCIATLEPEINYYQGMNYILLFLYQVLNYDEERTFYIFWAMLKETKFIQIFNDNMKELVIYFKVFEKIIEYNYQDIYYSLLKKQVMTEFFATQWFVTLFNGETEEFEKEKAPKFLILVFESFLYYGWAGILNIGLALCIYNKEKILNYSASNLISYMIKSLNSIKNIGEEDFPKIKKIIMNNSEKINENYVQKLINVINFEVEHPILEKEEL